MAKNRSELVAEVAKKIGKTQTEVNTTLEAFLESFVDVVKTGGKLTIPGYMSIERTDRAARKGRNPQTGETILISAGHGVKITAGSKMKNAAQKA